MSDNHPISSEAREAAVQLRFNRNGSVDVLFNGWEFVHINYDYRYTDNASRAQLAKWIRDLLINGPDKAQECAQLRAERDEAMAGNGSMAAMLGGCRFALQEISKGAGPFNRNPLKHAENTVEAMKELARSTIDEIDSTLLRNAALKATGKEGK